MVVVKNMAKDTVVYTFGRFNPISFGHATLINTVYNAAKKENGDPIIFASTSHDPKKNPLKFEQKIYFLRRAFSPKVAINTNKKLSNPFLALDDLVKKYDHVILYVGSDRFDEMSKLESYFMKSISPKHPQKTIEIRQSGGERTENTISGTKMRQMAENGDLDSFLDGVPKEMSPVDGRKMFYQTRAGMGIKD